jgi:O-antigen/teichoic acid export membrane protein
LLSISGDFILTIPNNNEPQDQQPIATDKSADSNLSKPLLNSNTLKSLAIKGSIWIMIGFGVAQFQRLVGNVILTRLLSPEMFGMMSMVGAMLAAVAMFSDVGIAPNIIQSKRGDDPDFLRTAWSMQIVRGIGLTLAAALASWPWSIFSNEPRLFLLGIALGLASMINGLDSISLVVHSRRMNIKILTILGIVTSTAGLIAKVTWAWYFPSVWAFVVGTFVSNIMTLIASHTVMATIPMRWQWETASVREFVRFGRWMFISTALGFLASRLDVLILGRMGGMEIVGFYVLAKNLALVVTTALRKLSAMILLPVYSRLAERNIQELRRKTFKVRAILLVLSLPPLWFLILGGQFVIDILYDERYQQAGWMVQILSVSAVAIVVRVTLGPILLAVGDSFRHMIDMAVRVGLYIICMAVGMWFGAIPGFLIGITVAEWLSYLVLLVLIHPYGVSLPLLDLAVFGSTLIMVGIALVSN